MKALLSDMKRIITHSEARFLFLGGRLLHDDWLADGARRQPLLTSIFSDEIYLPSLLCDRSIEDYSPTKQIPENNINLSDFMPTFTVPLQTRIEEFFFLAISLVHSALQAMG